MKIKVLEIKLLFLLTISVELSRCTFTPVLEIRQGKLRGLRSSSGYNRYFGIPYATSERFQVSFFTENAFSYTLHISRLHSHLILRDDAEHLSD